MNNKKIEQTRIHNRLRVAREGIPFFIISGCITAIFFLVGFISLGFLMGLISLFILYFFRDPARNLSAPVRAVVSPADGKIIAIQFLNNTNNILNEPAIKVSIFMSLFNVHVNRIPLAGRIMQITHNPGRFFSANLDKASDENEQNRITLKTDDGHKIVCIQIAGLIARRIVCWVKERQLVSLGQRYGLIRFGSRLDIYLPYTSKLAVQTRDKVRGGETILGYLPDNRSAPEGG